ncbi:hypothetical protein M8J76_002555 [Diaphorina citri]|nr:hypothetical protein M8J76_002555 [Diaphorina citri]
MNTRRSQNTPAKTAQGGAAIGQTQQAQYANYASQQQQQQQTVDRKPIVGGTQSTEAMDTDGKKPKPEWQLRKIDPELKRLRQNARVKKVVKPKTAIMVLHEMHPDIVYKIDEVASNKTSIYRVHFELNKKNYSGEGFSKKAEKNAMETDEDKKFPTDDFPWGKLASFALQKLMDSCTEKANEVPPYPVPTPTTIGPYGGHQTFSHPNHVSFSNYTTGGFQTYQQREITRAGFPELSAVTKRPTLPRKKFPENPLEYNPVALFNQTWPNTEPSFDTSIGADGKPEHTAALTLEGFRFSAIGKNKKEVKTNLTKAVISTLKGVKYPDGFTAQVIQA